MGVYGTGAYGGGTYQALAAITSIDPEDARVSRVAAGQERAEVHFRTFALINPAASGSLAWRNGRTFVYGASTTGTSVVTQDEELIDALLELKGVFVEV